MMNKESIRNNDPIQHHAESNSSKPHDRLDMPFMPQNNVISKYYDQNNRGVATEAKEQRSQLTQNTSEDLRQQHEEIREWKDVRLRRLEQFTADLEGEHQQRRQERGNAPSFGHQDRDLFQFGQTCHKLHHFLLGHFAQGFTFLILHGYVQPGYLWRSLISHILQS